MTCHPLEFPDKLSLWLFCLWLCYFLVRPDISNKGNLEVTVKIYSDSLVVNIRVIGILWKIIIMRDWCNERRDNEAVIFLQLKNAKCSIVRNHEARWKLQLSLTAISEWAATLFLLFSAGWDPSAVPGLGQGTAGAVQRWCPEIWDTELVEKQNWGGAQGFEKESCEPTVAAFDCSGKGSREELDAK